MKTRTVLDSCIRRLFLVMKKDLLSSSFAYVPSKLCDFVGASAVFAGEASLEGLRVSAGADGAGVDGAGATLLPDLASVAVVSFGGVLCVQPILPYVEIFALLSIYLSSVRRVMS